MAELRLIYFEGCPNAERVRRSLEGTGYKFDEVIFGTTTGSEGGCSLEIPTTQEIQAKIVEAGVRETKKAKLLAPTGSLGSIITVILCPVCKPAIAALLGSVGLGFVVNESILQSVLVIFLALTIGGLLWSFLKVHRNIWPVILGATMSLALYLGRYVYFGYMENNVLTYGSIAGLVAVSIWNFRLKKKTPVVRVPIQVLELIGVMMRKIILTLLMAIPLQILAEKSKTTFLVEGMTCASCAGSIEKSVRKVPEVDSVNISVKAGKVTVGESK